MPPHHGIGMSQIATRASFGPHNWLVVSESVCLQNSTIKTKMYPEKYVSGTVIPVKGNGVEDQPPYLHCCGPKLQDPMGLMAKTE